MKIKILNTDPKHPINPYLLELVTKLERYHSVSIIRSEEEVTDGDLLFLVSCNQIIDNNVLRNFKHVMVLHASDLPKGRGWSPHIWEIIGGAEKITLSLIDAVAQVDCGDIYRAVMIDIPKSALWDEINDLLFNAEINMIEFAVENFESLQKCAQSVDVEPTYYHKRQPPDSEIDAYKSIAEQFDLIRVCDPNRFPAIFQLHGECYKLVLEKI